ncbi:thiamine-binding protein [Micrococcaceae bacterium Sec5.7]
MLLAFSVAPSGIPASQPADADGATRPQSPDASVHDAVAAAVKIVRESGLPNQTDSMFTTIEGEWDEVFAVVKRATEAVGQFGSRVSLVIKADIRPGYSGELTAKVERLENAIAVNP